MERGAGSILERAQRGFGIAMLGCWVTWFFATMGLAMAVEAMIAAVSLFFEGREKRDS